MKELYKNTETEEHYKMLKPVGSWKRDGCTHYALWQPVKKVLFFWVPSRQAFWLDMYGFIKV